VGFSDSTTSVGNGDLTTVVALLALLWICVEFGRLLSVGLLMLLPVGSNILRKIYLQISLAQLSKQLIFSITSWRPSTTVADKQLTTVCLRPELIYPSPGWVLVMVVGGGGGRGKVVGGPTLVVPLIQSPDSSPLFPVRMYRNSDFWTIDMKL